MIVGIICGVILIAFAIWVLFILVGRINECEKIILDVEMRCRDLESKLNKHTEEMITEGVDGAVESTAENISE